MTIDAKWMKQTRLSWTLKLRCCQGMCKELRLSWTLKLRCQGTKEEFKEVAAHAILEHRFDDHELRAD